MPALESVAVTVKLLPDEMPEAQYSATSALVFAYWIVGPIWE